MPHATKEGRKRLSETRRRGGDEEFDLNNLFPAHPRLPDRGPFRKQAEVYRKIQDGSCKGGGIVYQGGLGAAKTMCGAAAVIMVQHAFPGTVSAVGRETYSALVTSTYDEFAKMLSRMPRALVKTHSRPGKNAIGWVEWAIGGKTFFLSLSDVTNWASANFGFEWIDEGHLQDPVIIEKFGKRLRQEEGPRVQLITTNPYGHFYCYQWAHPKSKTRRESWHWIESSSLENPALPKDYIDRLLEAYPPGTLAYRRWVLGQAAALEGSVFGDIFDPSPESAVHVVPDFEIPRTWDRGRGLDWGVDNPCAVTWGAIDQYETESWWIYRSYQQSGLAAEEQGRRILEMEKNEGIRWTPSDPEIFRRIHPVPGLPQVHSSTADEFIRVGCKVTPANNSRRYGLDLLFKLMALDQGLHHPIRARPPAPRLFILNNESNEELIDCLEGLQWVGESANRGSPDDVKKKDDHLYDALRYLVAERPQMIARDPIRYRGPAHHRRKGYVGYG